STVALPAGVDLGPQVLVVQVLDLAERVPAERRQGRGRRVLPGLPRVTGAGDDGGDARLLRHPSQRGLGSGNSRARVGGEGTRLGRDGGELGGGAHAGRIIHAGERLADVERLAVAVVGP